jgi:hypothetical protein
MASKHLHRSAIQQSQFINDATKYIDKNTSILPDLNESTGNNSNVFVSLQLIQFNYQCFCEWSKTEMKEFWIFNSKIHKTNWQRIYDQSGKSLEDKTGFALTKIPINKYPKCDLINNLSPEITLFELRVSKKIRVHGFRKKAIFFLCWLDKDHKICK